MDNKNLKQHTSNRLGKIEKRLDSIESKIELLLDFFEVSNNSDIKTNTCKSNGMSKSTYKNVRKRNENKLSGKKLSKVILTEYPYNTNLHKVCNKFFPNSVLDNDEEFCNDILTFCFVLSNLMDRDPEKKTFYWSNIGLSMSKLGVSTKGGLLKDIYEWIEYNDCLLIRKGKLGNVHFAIE